MWMIVVDQRRRQVAIGFGENSIRDQVKQCANAGREGLSCYVSPHQPPLEDDISQIEVGLKRVEIETIFDDPDPPPLA